MGIYGPRGATPVGCPVHAWIGDADPFASARGMEAWGEVAPCGFRLVEQHDALVREVAEHLVAIG